MKTTKKKIFCKALLLFVMFTIFNHLSVEANYISISNNPDNPKKDFIETAAGINLEMIFVQGGTFVMGCTEEQETDCYENEYYPHNVTLTDFYIGKFEVTQAQWRKVMGVSHPISDPSRFSNCDNCPVENISWIDANEFLEKLSKITGKNYRLPTEAEWEYAARGGASSTSSASVHTANPTKYAGSNNIEEVAWHRGNSGNKTHPVGSKKPNELGIYDMSGNVWEWCSNWYGVYGICSNNPTGPVSGDSKVLRGGSWRSNERTCRVSHRNYSSQGTRINFFGLRVVCEF